MAWSDWRGRLRQAFAQRPTDATIRPDGGTSCYRPVKRRSPEPAVMQGNDYGQPVSYVHTGFTGMTPPVSYGMDPGYGQQPSYGQPGYGQTAYGQTVYDQSAYGQTAYGQPAYGPGAYEQPAYGQTAYMQQSAPYSPQDSFPQQAYGQTALFRNAPQPDEKSAVRPEHGWFSQRETPRQPDNISYMPGFAPDSAVASAKHTEHILTMTGLKSCYDAIECMKNGETVFVMLDAIANEGESMRCQDMLAGAAFTLGCSVRMLQGGRIVLIVPEGVRILPEQQAVRQEFPPMFVRAPQAQTPQTQAPQSAEPMKRERRSSPRAEEWNAARSGKMDRYNPYTGTMPVAAGAYSSFGGCGY